MENQTLNHCERVVIGNRRNQGDTTPEPKGKEIGHYWILRRMTDRHTIPGSKMAPTAFTSISDMELGNPYTLLNRGMEVVRPTDGVDGTGCLKKRTTACNERDRGHCLNLKGC